MKRKFLFIILTICTSFLHATKHNHTDENEIRYYNASPLDEGIQNELRTGSVWQTFLSLNPNWFVMFDENSKMPHRAFGEPIQLNGSSNTDVLNFLSNTTFTIPVDLRFEKSSKNDNYINIDIIFERTNEILNNDNIRKKIKDKFLVVGTEVPLSGSGDNENIIKTSKKQIETEVLKFKKILKKQNLKNNIFGLVIEPGMKYMHSSVTKPYFTNFTNKKNISKKNNFVYEAHSTDYQSKKILKQLVKNNFKFLKVGPELTYSYSRSLFFMENIEKNNFKLKNSNIKKIIFSAMLKNRKYWEGYYEKKTTELFLNSKLDRMRYYFDTKPVVNSIKTLKKNINLLDSKKILCFMSLTEKKEFLNFKNKKLSNFDIIKLIFISRTLKRYFSACAHRFN